MQMGGHVFDDRLKEPLALKGAGELDLLADAAQAHAIGEEDAG